MSQSSLPIVFRRFWKPVAAIGAGGTAGVVWLEEMMLYAEEILGLILLPIIAGMFYLFNILAFNSRLPKRDDLKKKS